MLVHAIRAGQRISAKNVHVVYLCELVAQSLHLNRCFCITPCPQKMHTLSEDRHARALCIRSLRRSNNKITQQFQKTNRIRHVVDHELRKSLSSMQNDKPALLDSGVDFYRLGPQSRKKALPV